MKTWTRVGAVGGMIALLLVSCEKPTEMTSDKTRELTTLDKKPVNLTPTSDDRFTPPGAAITPPSQDAPYTFTAGEGWVTQPASQFRLVNFSLPSGGEVYLSASGGGILPNINRWFGQFQQAPLTGEQFAQLSKISFMGTEGYYVETSGDYSPASGRAVKPNMVLSGAIAEVDGQIMTVKMIASPEETAEHQDAFKLFCKTLRPK